MNTVSKIVAFTERKQWGDIQRITENTGYSQAMVSKTLRGDRNNNEIVDYAYNMVKNRPTNLQILSQVNN